SREHSIGEVIETLAGQFNLSKEEINQLLPSGRQTVVRTRISWARTYLKKAGLLESTGRGKFRITQRGIEVLKQDLSGIDRNFLGQFEEFREFQARRQDVDREDPENADIKESPEETLESSYGKLRAELAAELLDRMKTCSSGFFESLVIEVIVKMGYGGNRIDAGKAVGKSGDGGIDGIIKEDKLGLDTIFIQAKRWEHTVGRPEIHKFVGALSGQRAKKGLFITTSDFTKDAKDYVSRIDTKIVLIDGESLAQLMIDHNVGVSTVAAYELKKIDSDYFAED
ncbi:MAG: restriction endonuclease, partial [bacterium]